jgi:hypothetical protein
VVVPFWFPTCDDFVLNGKQQCLIFTMVHEASFQMFWRERSDPMVLADVFAVEAVDWVR